MCVPCRSRCTDALVGIFSKEPPATISDVRAYRSSVSEEGSGIQFVHKTKCNQTIALHGDSFSNFRWEDMEVALYETAALLNIVLPGMVERGTIIAYKASR